MEARSIGFLLFQRDDCHLCDLALDVLADALRFYFEFHHDYDQGYIALSLDTPASEVARWRAALAQLNRDGRYRQLYDHYAH